MCDARNIVSLGCPGRWSVFLYMYPHTRAHMSRDACVCTHTYTGWRRGKPAVVLVSSGWCPASATFHSFSVPRPLTAFTAAPEPTQQGPPCAGEGATGEIRLESQTFAAKDPPSGHRLRCFGRTSQLEGDEREARSWLNHPTALTVSSWPKRARNKVGTNIS